MRAVAGQDDRGPIASLGLVVGSVAILTLSVLTGVSSTLAAGVVIPVVIGAVAYRRLLTWRSLLAGMILVILFVPIKRYELPGSLPFDLEFYRVYMGLVFAGWCTSLLIDPRVRWRRAGFELPIYLLIVTTIGSELANGQSISDKGLQGDVIKALMFFASFLLVVYLMVSVIRTRRHLDFLVKVFVVGGAVVAGSSIVEARTGVNIFEHLERVLPFLRFVHDQTDVQTRQGGLRVFGSAQSPIALGAALVMVVPLALYTAITNSKRWWIPVALTGLASLATVSRTPVIMLMVVGVTYFILKPRQLLKMWPLLIPAVIAAQVAVPGALGSLKASFFPPGGIVAEQSQHAGWAGSGRIADLGPAFKQWQQRPFLGEGYGTRKTDRKNRQQQILDDQWLKTLLENGALGTFAYVWLYVAFIRRIGRIARRDDGDRGWLCTAFVASIASFAVGMFFYDAFSFIQVTLLSYIVLGFGAVVLSIGDRWTTEPRLATR